MILKILALIAVIGCVVEILYIPSMIGKTRENYSYSNFIAAIIGALIVVPLCLRILGWI